MCESKCFKLCLQVFTTVYCCFRISYTVFCYFVALYCFNCCFTVFLYLFLVFMIIFSAIFILLEAEGHSCVALDLLWVSEPVKGRCCVVFFLFLDVFLGLGLLSIRR